VPMQCRQIVWSPDASAVDVIQPAAGSTTRHGARDAGRCLASRRSPTTCRCREPARADAREWRDVRVEYRSATGTARTAGISASSSDPERGRRIAFGSANRNRHPHDRMAVEDQRAFRVSSSDELPSRSEYRTGHGSSRSRS